MIPRQQTPQDDFSNYPLTLNTQKSSEFYEEYPIEFYEQYPGEHSDRLNDAMDQLSELGELD